MRQSHSIPPRVIGPKLDRGGLVTRRKKLSNRFLGPELSPGDERREQRHIDSPENTRSQTHTVLKCLMLVVFSAMLRI
jgi:hypothetical protein